MVTYYLISIVIGVAGAVLIGAAWVTFEILKMKNRCWKITEIVLLNLRAEGNIRKSLVLHQGFSDRYLTDTGQGAESRNYSSG